VIKSVRPGEMVVKIVHDELVKLLGGEAEGLTLAASGPTVIMLCGLQGSGKTTTVGKLATRLQEEGRSPLLVAADVQRPAAIEQLRVLGGQVGAPVYAEEGGDPVRICTQALQVADLHNADTILLDTAGRLHVDEALMLELEGIVRGAAPHEILLVLDAMTGQDAVTSAEEFARRLALTGAVLTNLDGDARGGAALSLREVTGVPIKYVGVGEKLDALEAFHPDRLAGRILGMGDVVSLVEKAQATVDAEEQEKMQERLLKNTFTLEDFQKQLAQLRKMGSIRDLLGMVPGLGRQLQGVDVDEAEFKRIEAIIQSMTKDERNDPEIVDGSRRARIARGCGVETSDVSQLLKQFRQMKKLFGRMGKSGMLGSLLGGGGGGEMPALDPGALMGGGGGMPGLPGSGGGGYKSQKDKKKERRKRRKRKKRRK
jgi:signal recognition particle subunit SRP54